MHCACASQARGDVPLGAQASSMVVVWMQSGIAVSAGVTLMLSKQTCWRRTPSWSEVVRGEGGGLQEIRDEERECHVGMMYHTPPRNTDSHTWGPRKLHAAEDDSKAAIGPSGHQEPTSASARPNQ